MYNNIRYNKIIKKLTHRINNSINHYPYNINQIKYKIKNQLKLKHLVNLKIYSI